MPVATWSANSAGEYWINVGLGQHATEVLIDTGLIDAKGEIGFSVDASLYDAIKKAGGFRKFQRHARMMADGSIRVAEAGYLDAQLLSPQSQHVIGPIVDTHVYRGFPGVPNRVGLSFFHRLKACQVLWNLDQRLWQIDYP